MVNSLDMWYCAQTRLETFTTVLFGLVPMDYMFFAFLIRNHATCYLVFLGFMWIEVPFLNNSHARMVRMGTAKMCILIIIKRGRQCKVGWKRVTPYHPGDPLYRIDLFISKCLQRRSQNIYSIYLCTELYQKRICYQMIHTIMKLMNMITHKQQIASLR